MIIAQPRLRPHRRLRKHLKVSSIVPVDQPARNDGEAGTVSHLIATDYPAWLWSALIVVVDAPAEHLVTTYADAGLDFAGRWPVDSLNQTLAYAQLARAVVCADTCGGASPHLDDVWNILFAQADPHIRAALSATGIAVSLLEDCVQEAWLTIWRCLHRFDADPECGDFACCLCTVARRTAQRVQREEQRAAILGNVLPIGLPYVGKTTAPDPSQSEPIVQLIQQETDTALAAAIESLETEVSPDAQRLVESVLADPTSQPRIAFRLHLTIGRFRTLWRKVKTHLRARLQPLLD